MRRALGVRGLSTLAGNLLLLRRIHGSESTIAPATARRTLGPVVLAHSRVLIVVPQFIRHPTLLQIGSRYDHSNGAMSSGRARPGFRPNLRKPNSQPDFRPPGADPPCSS